MRGRRGVHKHRFQLGIGASRMDIMFLQWKYTCFLEYVRLRVSDILGLEKTNNGKQKSVI
jgi:hypothetical protein